MNRATKVLKRAVENNDLKAAEAALIAGAYVNAGSDFDSKPMGVAAECGYPELVQLLLSWGAKVNPGDPYTSPLLEAASGGYATIIQLLLDADAAVDVHGCNGTSLMIAAKKNRPDLIRILLDAGANVNAGAQRGKTALIYLLDNDNGYRTRIPDDRSPAIKMLLAGGANVNLRGRAGVPPLHYAVRCYSGAVQLLLDAGADANARNIAGKANFICGTSRESIVSLETLDFNPCGQIAKVWGEGTIILERFTALDIAHARKDEETVQVLLRGLHRHIAAALSVMPHELSSVEVHRKILEHWLGVPLQCE